MAANVLHNHHQNPYGTSKTERQAVLFMAKDYQVSVLCLLSPIALRVMLAMAGNLNSEGYVVASLDTLARRMQKQRSFINKGILELAKWDIIRKKKRGQYWLSPYYFRVLLV